MCKRWGQRPWSRMRSRASSWALQGITCGISRPTLTRFSTFFRTQKQLTTCLHHRTTVGPPLLQVCGSTWGPCPQMVPQWVPAVAGVPAHLVHPHLHRTIYMWWSLTQTLGGLHFSQCVIIVFRNGLEKGCYKIEGV